MNRLHFGVLAAVGAAVFAAGAAAEPARPGPGAGAGMIDRDPSVVEAPAPPAAAAPSATPRSRVEVPGTTRGGGWKVDGPFLHTLRGTTGPDGQVTTDCVPSRSGE